MKTGASLAYTAQSLLSACLPGLICIEKHNLGVRTHCKGCEMLGPSVDRECRRDSVGGEREMESDGIDYHACMMDETVPHVFPLTSCQTGCRDF